MLREHKVISKAKDNPKPMSQCMKKLLSLVGPLAVAGVLFSTGASVASFTLLSQFRALA
jgi:hypothetical protein